jgi:hypothetical protein
MALTDDVRDLAARILARLDEARDFYLRTRQAWRVLQQFAHEGRSVSIVAFGSSTAYWMNLKTECRLHKAGIERGCRG